MRRCAHAYYITPLAANKLLEIYRECTEPDSPTDKYCSIHCCTYAKGFPTIQDTKIRFKGIIAQNTSIPHYLHFKPCRTIVKHKWDEYGCMNKFDYAKYGDGTISQDP